ncbi:unnamed protein product [Triticum turgidum subsp. durum]|uniref:LNS2/PITP domain-containing protein n=1 Tax=Triticum turgidum subsp. durum TaxID=4567 RepID=A0A9R0QD33_TRITD|nr:unnamed protein product [Triticum turgidum subsp. durum]
MLLDNSGQAYFMRELVPGGEDSETAAEEATSEPETPLRSKSDGELYSQLVGPELNEDQEVQNGEEFDSYGYSKLEEAEDLANQAGGGGGNSEMLLVSVNGCVLTAPISSTEENMEDVQLSDPQFHLGPGESSSGDLSRGGEVWESGILDGLYISQEKVKFDSEHPSEALEELREVSILKDGSHDIPVNEHESLHVSVNEGQTCVALTNALDVSVNNDDAYQPLTNEDKTCDIPLVQSNCVALTNEDEVQSVSRSENNGLNYQPLVMEDGVHEVSGNNGEGYQPFPNKDEALDVSVNNDDAYQPLTNEDETCDIPLVQSNEACKSPSMAGKVCDANNEIIEDEVKGLSQSGNNGPDYQTLNVEDEANDISGSNAEVDPILPNKEESLDILENNDDNITRSEDCSPVYGKAADLSCEGGSDERRKDTTPSNIGACKSDRLRMSPSSDRDKLGSIPENPTAEEEINKEEHPQLQKGLGFEISLCGHLLRPGMGQTSADEVFQQHLVPEEDFKLSGPSIIKNANLIVRIGCNYFTWSKVSHVVLGKAVFGPDFCVEPIDAIPVERQETPNSRDDSLGLSPSRRWRLWPIPFRISRSLQRSNSDSSEDIFLDTETVLSPMDEQAPANNKDQSPRKQFVRTLIPTSEQVASLNLKEGQNIVTFSFCTRVFGKQQVDAHIYVWKWNAKIVISDVDGTITRSDVLGQVMPLVGRDWSQSGVARLFSAIKENGYQLIFLSARAIVQAYLTKNFLFNLKQDGKVMPNGPVVISPDGLFPSLYREVIRRAPHEFKIACLEDIKALFPSDYNPFYAGFGNRDTDELTYKKMGISKGKIFIINPKGEVAINSSVDVKSYTSLHTLVNDMFPPTTLVEQEDYNSWNYWKVPLPDIDL